MKSVVKSQAGGRTLVEMLRYRADLQPDATAYIHVEEGSPDAPITYSELDRQSRAIAAKLQECTRVGQRAVLLYPPDLNYVSAFFGCLYAGVIAVPAYPPDPSRLQRTLPRLQAIIADSDATVVLTTAPILSMAEMIFGVAPELAAKTWVATDVLSRGTEEGWAPSEGHPEDPAFLQYTSGSTGTPRGVVLSHRNLLHNLGRIAEAFEISEQSVGVSWLPPYHDMGLIGGILAPLSRGRPTALMSPIAFIQRPVRWLQAITRFRATTSGGPNFAYELCLRKVSEADREQLDLSSWTLAFSGAEPVRSDTLARFVEMFGPCGFRRRSFYPCYGLAEATLLVAGGRPEDDVVTQNVDPDALQHDRVRPAPRDTAARTLVGCGSSLSDQKIVVVDPRQMTACGDAHIGEIWVSGPSVARGYWNRPEETKATFGGRIAGNEADVFLRTGDLGYLDQGQLFVTGRLKDLVIVRGRNHYPQDIEQTVENAHGSVRRGCCGAFSVDVAGDEHLVVVVEIERRNRERRNSTTRAEASSDRRSRDRREDNVNAVDHISNLWRAADAEPRPFDPEELCADVRQAVLQHHDLHVYDVVLVQPGVLPKTSSGKIQRQECRKGYLAGTLESVASSRVRNLGHRAHSSINVPRTQEQLEQLPVSERSSFILTTLRGMVARALGTDVTTIDLHRPVSTMGLDSMLAVELAHHVEKVFSIVVPVTWVLRGASVSELASQLEVLRLQHRPDATGAASAGDGQQQLSAGQEALWFLHHLTPESGAYNVHCALRIRSRVDSAALRTTVDKLVRRHAILSTKYPAVDGRPSRIAGAPSTLEVERSPSEEDLRARLVAEVHRPFDLAIGPLFRSHLFTRGEQDHVLLLVSHHIVADLWSLVVLLRDLGEVYTATREGRDLAATDEGSPTFDDFVGWQRSWLSSQTAEQAWSYWSSNLTGAPTSLDLPFDRPRPPAQTHRGSTTRFALAPALARACRDLAQAEGTTLYGLLLAAYQVLLARYSDRNDVSVGTLVAGRSRAGLQSVVGYFVNPVVVRVDLGGDPDFREVLARVRARLLDGLEHQDYPFPELVHRLQPARDPSRSPLFQTVFVLEKTQLDRDGNISAVVLGVPGVSTEIGGLEIESTVVPGLVSQFDLTLNVIEHREEIHGLVQFNTDLFDPATIDRLVEHFCTLLDALVCQPDAPVTRASLLPHHERSTLMARNPAPTPYADDVCVDELVDAAMRRTPDAVAVAGIDGELTYRHLVQRAEALAGDLRTLGAGPGTIVAICMGRRPELVIALLAVLKVGAAYLPLDPAYPTERLGWMLEDSTPRAILTDASAAPLVEAFPDIARWPVEHWSTHGSGPTPAILRDAGSRAYVIFTSGSTGRPKGVEIPHRAVVNFLASMRERPGMDENDVVLATTSLSFDIAALEIFLPLTVGARVVVATREVVSDAVATALALQRHGVTTMQATPSGWRLLLAGGWSGGPVRALCGGEPLSEALATALREHCSEVWNLYGPTETTIWSAIARVGEGPVSMGDPIANTRIYVTEQHQALAPLGVAGELCIGGAGLALGYLNRPAVTAERFTPDGLGGGSGQRLYRTGDLVRWRAEGRLDFLGRIDHQVKVRGHRIELGEVEAALRGDARVRDAVVVVHGAADGGALVAYVLAEEATGLSDQLRRAVEARLPDYMVPSAIVRLQAFPQTSNGKTDRLALAKRPLETSADLDGASPRTPLERVIAAVWCEVLDRERVGIHDGFFELGGHSLLATRIAASLRELLQVELALRVVFQAPTVAGLARAILDEPTGAIATRNAELLEELETMSDVDVERQLTSTEG